jgi:hypothetical protein
MTTNTMEGRRLTAKANDPEAVALWPDESGDYWLSWEQDTEAGTTEVLHLGHRLNPGYDRGRHEWGYPYRWTWAAYAVWPKDEQGAPGIYEWVIDPEGRGTWLVQGVPFPTQKDAVTVALRIARSRS